jgi:hypothetical protein
MRASRVRGGVAAGARHGGERRLRGQLWRKSVYRADLLSSFPTRSVVKSAHSSSPPLRGVRRRLHAIAPLLALVLAGCSVPLLGERADPTAAPEENIVVLEVENQNFKDARIYVIWNSSRDRVGMVTGNTRQTFRLRGQEGQLRVQVDFVAGSGFTTDPIQVWRGETIQLVIPPSA